MTLNIHPQLLRDPIVQWRWNGWPSQLNFFIMKWVSVAWRNGEYFLSAQGPGNMRDCYEGEIIQLWSKWSNLWWRTNCSNIPGKMKHEKLKKGLAAQLRPRWAKFVPSTGIKELFTLRAMYDPHPSPAHLDNHRCSEAFLLSLLSPTHHLAFNRFSYSGLPWGAGLQLSSCRNWGKLLWISDSQSYHWQNGDNDL